LPLADTTYWLKPQRVGGTVIPTIRTTAALTVWVVDDEPSILALLTRGLPRVGTFDVVAAQSADELASLVQAGGVPDVVLIDFGIPVPPALRAELRRLQPSPRLLYFTGRRLSDEQRAWVDDVLHKPMTLRDLAGELTAQARVS